MSIGDFILYDGLNPMIGLDFFRGDSYPITSIIRHKVTSQPIPVTGYSFVLTVNDSEEPVGTAGQKFQVIGVVDANQADNPGAVSFTPTASQSDISPAQYFFDIQVIDPASNVRTLLKAPFNLIQDITKNIGFATEYNLTFDTNALVGNVLTVTHNLNDPYAAVITVYDNNNDLAGVTLESISSAQFTIDFGAPISGTWHLTARIILAKEALIFDNTDLVGGILTVTHGLGNAYPIPIIYDDNDELAGATITSVDINSYTVDFGGVISGIWHLTTVAPVDGLPLTFDDTDLVAGVLTVDHTLGTSYPAVTIYDNNGKKAMVSVTSVSDTQFTVDFGGAIVGTWHLTAI